MSLIQHFQPQIEAAPKKLNDRGDVIPPLCFFVADVSPGITSIVKVAGAEDTLEELSEKWEYVEMSSPTLPRLRKKS